MDWKELLFNEIRDLKKDNKEHANAVESRLDAIEKDLNYHIKRTDLAEKRLEGVETKVEPILAHVNGLKYVKWLVGSIIALIILAGSLMLALTRLGIV